MLAALRKSWAFVSLLLIFALLASLVFWLALARPLGAAALVLSIVVTMLFTTQNHWQRCKRKEEEARARLKAERANAEARAREKGYASYNDMLEAQAAAAFDANWNAMLAASQTAATIQPDHSGVRHLKARKTLTPPPPGKNTAAEILHERQLIWKNRGLGQETDPILKPTPTPTASPAPTPTIIPYQEYKTIGSLTPFEATIGGQVAYNAHQLLAQANQFYFWSNDDPGKNSDPPVPLYYDKNFPIPRDPTAYKRYWYDAQDVFEYTGGRIPFVCGDVPDWTYFMAGYNLQTLLPNVSAQYPNRWPRSAYGYERMFQMIRSGDIEGKSEIWDIQANGNNYMFTTDNVPELGDIVVTKTLGDLRYPDADHVVIVAEVHGFTPDKVFIIEGNPDDGTFVRHTLEELKNRIPGLRYILYGHPTLP